MRYWKVENTRLPERGVRDAAREASVLFFGGGMGAIDTDSIHPTRGQKSGSQCEQKLLQGLPSYFFI
jgi:hypothetical protein